MAELTPLWMQDAAYPAELDRQLLDALGSYSGGIFASGDLKVHEAGTPGMSVVVDSGAVSVRGTDASGQGAYFCRNQGAKTLSIDTAPTTNDRIDLVVARVRDSAYIGGGVNAWALEVVKGTAAASPSPPAAPASSVTLAEVRVPASASQITDSDITDKRTLVASAAPQDGTITAAKLADDAVTPRTLSAGVITSAFDNSQHPTLQLDFNWNQIQAIDGLAGGGVAIIRGVVTVQEPDDAAAITNARLLVDGAQAGAQGRGFGVGAVVVGARYSVGDASHTYQLQARSEAGAPVADRASSFIEVILLP